MNILITGGAGFIGSRAAKKLLGQGHRVVAYDNLSCGRMENISSLHENRNFSFIKADVLNKAELLSAMNDIDEVWHFSANAEVRAGEKDTEIDFVQNAAATHGVLEAMRKNNVPSIVFPSTSAIYGEAKTIPTPEDYSPCLPVSLYGATKLAAEALISAYGHMFGIKSLIFRFANVIGPGATHGVIPDFIRKLRKNTRELEILGDGKQDKSYLYVDDCISAMMLARERAKSGIEIFNIGTDSSVTVKELAGIVIRETGLKGVSLKYTGNSAIGGRGWRGDVKNMRLSVEKIKSIGWKPEYDSRQAVEKAVAELLGK